MNETPEINRLRYSESPLTGLVIVLLSFFCQWLNWFAYEKIDYDWKFTLVTPIILCIMYHFVQTDSGIEGNFSRGFFFIFAVLLPFLLGILLTILMLLTNPQISVFNPNEDYAGTVQEVIATYAGRFVITSLYMMIFALIDIPLLKIHDSKRTEN